MICRDGAASLTAALNSVKDLSDEIVLVDTGSVDDSVSIAVQHGVRVIHHPWTGSFAQARNVALRFATGDFIFFIDVDEVLASALPLRRAAQEATCAYLIPIRNFVRLGDPGQVDWAFLDLDSEGRPFYETESVRFFPRTASVAFEGAVHESVEPQLHALGTPIAALSDTWIDHLPSTVGLERKAQHYSALANEALAADPSDWFAARTLGLWHVRNGNLAQGITLLESCEARMPADTMVTFGLAAAYLAAGRLDEAVCLASLRNVGSFRPELSLLQSRILLELNHLEEALTDALLVVERRPRRPFAWCHLADVLDQVGLIQEAKRARRYAETLIEKAYIADTHAWSSLNSNFLLR